MQMLKLFFILTFLTGVVYPFSLTLIGQLGFKESANGSLLEHKGKVIGSKLIAQKFTKDGFFHSRPSAGDYGTVSSGASNFGPTSLKGKEFLTNQKELLPQGGLDAWSTSASGVDPHISTETALAQIPRVAHATGKSESELTTLILAHTQDITLGIWGQPRVNVLELNTELMKE